MSFTSLNALRGTPPFATPSDSKLSVPGSGDTVSASPAVVISRSSEGGAVLPAEKESSASTPINRGVAAYKRVMEAASMTAPTLSDVE